MKKEGYETQQNCLNHVPGWVTTFTWVKDIFKKGIIYVVCTVSQKYAHNTNLISVLYETNKLCIQSLHFLVKMKIFHEALQLETKFEFGLVNL